MPQRRHRLRRLQEDASGKPDPRSGKAPGGTRAARRKARRRAGAARHAEGVARGRRDDDPGARRGQTYVIPVSISVKCSWGVQGGASSTLVEAPDREILRKEECVKSTGMWV